LRSVRAVDGRPVDLAAALDVSGSDLQARLGLLARSVRPATQAGSLAAPAAAARAILGERRFRGSRVPRPLHRPLGWLGRQLHRLGRALGKAYHSISADLPGGSTVFWAVVAAAVAACAAVAAARLGRRRAGRLIEVQRRSAPAGAEDPRRLDREADSAEREGEYERALRLRFQAGLVRLIQAGAIPARQSFTNGELAHRLGSGSFSSLAHDFDQIVYGRRAAVDADAARARTEWRRVLEEARRT
jgi:hypothetical protein